MARKSKTKSTATPRRRARLFTWGRLISGVLMSCAAVVWLYFNLPLIDQYRSAERLRDREAERVQNLEIEIQELERQIARFDKGQEADEAAARERYGWTLPEERIVRIEVE